MKKSCDNCFVELSKFSLFTPNKKIYRYNNAVLCISCYRKISSRDQLKEEVWLLLFINWISLRYASFDPLLVHDCYNIIFPSRIWCTSIMSFPTVHRHLNWNSWYCYNYLSLKNALKLGTIKSYMVHTILGIWPLQLIKKLMTGRKS